MPAADAALQTWSAAGIGRADLVRLAAAINAAADDDSPPHGELTAAESQKPAAV